MRIVRYISNQSSRYYLKLDLDVAHGRRKQFTVIRRNLLYSSPHLESNKSAEDIKFDHIITELQEILIDPNFEKSLTTFMEDNWATFSDHAKGDAELKVFQAYQTQMRQYLQNVPFL